MSGNNKEEAVKIGIGLSTQFIGAALGLLTVIGGVITFLLGQRDFTWPSAVCLVFGTISLLASIFFGFKGIAKARNNGNRGWWVIEVSENDFNLQTKWGLLGIIFFSVSIFLLLKTPQSRDAQLDAIAGNQESIIKIAEYIVAGGKDCNRPGLTMDSLGAISGFFVGVANAGFDTDQIEEIKNILEERKDVSVLFIMGEVDKRELMGEVHQKFGSNISLARARAEYIKTEFKQFCSDRNISVVTMTRGAFHNGIDMDNDDLLSDRQVVMYCLSIK
jgi:hypothetical protein